MEEAVEGGRGGEAVEGGGREKERGKGSSSRKPVEVETEAAEDEKGRRMYHRRDKHKVKVIKEFCWWLIAEERSEGCYQLVQLLYCGLQTVLPSRPCYVRKQIFEIYCLWGGLCALK